MNSTGLVNVQKCDDQSCQKTLKTEKHSEVIVKWKKPWKIWPRDSRTWKFDICLAWVRIKKNSRGRQLRKVASMHADYSNSNT